MDFETHDILFSYEHPETLLKPLQEVLQAGPDHLKAQKPYSTYLPKILIIDSDKVQANIVTQLMAAAGYQSIAATTALEAYTAFLKGTYIPLIIVLGQKSVADPLFLHRILQQTTQKYGEKTSLFRLHPDPTSPSLRIPSQSLPSLMPLAPPDSPLPTGSVEQIEREKISIEGLDIGRYHIKTLIGGGLQGNVYQTYDRLREQVVALKAVQVYTMPYAVMRFSEEETNLFQQESDLISTLGHDHILTPLNTGRSYISGTPFIYKTMPYYEERSLAHWLASGTNQKTFAPQEVLPLALQLADTLQYLHSHRILYQNFKLSNLLVRNHSADMRNLHLLLTDFAVTQDGSFFSRTSDAFPYMAPERWQGQALPASDQYGLAVLLYELLAGRPPFQGISEHTMRLLHMNMQPQSPMMFNPHLSPSINRILMQALAKRPQDRFPSIDIFIKTFQQYCR